MEEFDEFDEFEEYSEPPQQQQQESDDDLTSEVLRIKGISDPDKIKFEDDNGQIIERAWDSLSREEQINILTQQEEPDNELDDAEIALINQIRNSGLDVNSYLQTLQTPVQKSYRVDELSDDELYALDLLDKIGSENITDEELLQATDAAKQNEELYKKTTEGLRREYKRLQEEEEARLLNERMAYQEREYQDFSNSIVNQIRSLKSFAGSDLQLSQNDVEDLSSFILERDESGVSAFGRAMQDHALITKAAFWLLNEDKITEELNKQIQESYNRGYEAASGKSRVAIAPKKQETSGNFDFVDDEEW